MGKVTVEWWEDDRGNENREVPFPVKVTVSGGESWILSVDEARWLLCGLSELLGEEA